MLTFAQNKAFVYALVLANQNLVNSNFSQNIAAMNVLRVCINLFGYAIGVLHTAWALLLFVLLKWVYQNLDLRYK